MSTDPNEEIMEAVERSKNKKKELKENNYRFITIVQGPGHRICCKVNMDNYEDRWEARKALKKRYQ